MGRKSKPPILISSAAEVRTEVLPSDGLPAFANYIDVPFERAGRRSITRLFFVRPTIEETENTVRLRDIGGKENLTVLGAKMPYITSGHKINLPLFDYCMERGFSEDFAATLVRLVINYLKGKRFVSSSLGEKLGAWREFVDFLFSYTENHYHFTLADIGKQLWMDYLQIAEANHRVNSETAFNCARALFKGYSATSLAGWLGTLRFAKRRRNASPEHTSELADAGYSDSVMYQILALCLEGFQRRIGYLKRYESLTEADMPSDWLCPGRDNTKRAHGKRWETESFELLVKWLNDEESGYQILIDHFILHHKAGVIKTSNHGSLRGGILDKVKALAMREEVRPLLDRFWKTTALWHGFSYPMNNRSILRFYLKKKTAQEPSPMINQIAWCLANLLMMQTGINKEVALSIPSEGECGQSILLRGNTVFVSDDGESTEAELYGFKERSGVDRRKVIPIVLPKDSPLFEMLVDYQRYVKVDFNGPFFELDKNFAANWNKAGPIYDFDSVYPIIDENGKQLSSIDTKKFRKVFASGQLLDRLQGIKDPNDLAECLRNDLNHGNLDTTLSHYLLKSAVGRSVIDMAIATITSEKLHEALRFKGKIDVDERTHVKKKVFLCDCEDPTNPSHDVAIALECKHYDLCLGCERSVITQFHLPYICTRILQYEEARLADPYIWPATFEDRWSIAHDALDQYVAKDKKNGQRLVDEAWVAAREGRFSLPPIINSNRM
jgi:hypothetical protein